MAIWHIFILELKQMVKSPVNMVLLLIMPVMMIALMGFAMKPIFNMQKDQPMGSFKVLCTIEDVGTLGQGASGTGDGFEAPGLISYLKATGLVEPVMTTRNSLVEQLISGEYPAAVIIPRGFYEKVAAGEKTQMEIMMAGKDTQKEEIISLLVGNYVQSLNTHSVMVRALTSQNRSQAAAIVTAGEILTGIQSRYQNSFNTLTLVEKPLWERMGSEPYFAVNMLVFFILAVGTGLGAGIVGDRQTRLYTRITSYPVRLSGYFAGKALSTMAMGMIQASFIVIITGLFMKVQWGKEWLGLALVVFLVILFSSGVAILLSGFVQSVKAVSAGLTVVFWIMTFIGGGFFPIPALASVSRYTVNKLAFEAIGGFMSGSSVLTEWKPILMLAAVSSLVFATGVLCYKRRALYE